MGKDLRLGGLIALSALATAATSASVAQDDTIRWEAVTTQIEAEGAQDRRIRAAIATWRTLSKSDKAGFDAYADFLLANPGWPDESKLRGLAEKADDLSDRPPATLVAFFTKYPARTTAGKAAYAFALARLGRAEQASAAARDAWTSGTLPDDVDAQLRGQFAGSLSAADHLRHADAALWQRDPAAAEQVLALVPATRRAVIAARIAFQRRAADAAQIMAAADPVGVMDAGYLADKARWLEASGNGLAARKLLAERLPLGQTPENVEKWYEAMLAQAKDAAAANQLTLAYQIASQVDDAYVPGTDVSVQNYGERDDYTSLTWLAGTVAFHELKRPADAMGMFARYAGGGQNPSTITKGLYWAGRAALAAGKSKDATDFFGKAAAYPDQFYGQLARERLGMPVPPPGTDDPATTLSAKDRAAFATRPVVRAAQLLGADGAWAEQTKFVRVIAEQATTPHDHLLADDLALAMGRPDLGVMAGHRATRHGHSGYDPASFPRMDVPEGERSNWTMIHAIARQESQFDRAIISYAGARGLMQLMPATAREQAGKNGVSYKLSSLFEPDYNIGLGSAYFRGLMRYYDGSYPLAVAAYNAGMGNVNKWLRANGDPRKPDVDILRWIEEIPIWQTKDYVQRVLENAVIYDMVNPAKDGPAPAAPLTRYLGKSQPG